ncbi:hypothetical protein D7Y06_07395 [Roseburia sp. 1XD42-69]|nr:hypothetical protein D7Y06_07395 [Roseburia sp. 1XD42-69]
MSQISREVKVAGPGRYEYDAAVQGNYPYYTKRGYTLPVE